MNTYIKFGIFAAVIITVLILSFIILRRVFRKAELSGEKSNNKIFVYRTKKTMIDNPLFTKWE